MVEIKATHPLFTGHFLQVELQDVLLPDGVTAHLEVVRHPGGAGVVALDADHNALLVRQFRVGAGAGLWEIPAGVLSPGEAPEVAAIRELQEEAGYKPGKIESLGGFYAAPGYSTEYLHLFLGTDLIESPLKGDIDEFIELARFPFAEALAMVDRGEIVEAKTMLGLLRAAARLNAR